MKPTKIVLASGSPRRRELLAGAGVDFSVLHIDIDESVHVDESPTDYIERMVTSKAAAAIDQLQADTTLPESLLVITADTIGVLPDGKTVLTKPESFDHAHQMWQQMSDDTHEVWTAVCVTHVERARSFDNNTEAAFIINAQERIMNRTEVTFVPLTPDMMTAYWRSGEPVDKAGGYAIQGGAAAWVSTIHGSYTNVVGLPLAQTLALINKYTHGAVKPLKG